MDSLLNPEEHGFVSYPGMDDIFMIFLLLWCFTGGLGDCWLMSALSCLGQYPQKLILGDNVKNTRSGVNRGYNVEILLVSMLRCYQDFSVICFNILKSEVRPVSASIPHEDRQENFLYV